MNVLSNLPNNNENMFRCSLLTRNGKTKREMNTHTFLRDDKINICLGL